MSWRRRLRDVAVAGGLAGGCATHSVASGAGTTGSTGGPGTTGGTGTTGGAGTTGGTGGAGTTGSTSSGTGGTGGVSIGPACNANPDPCCLCDPGGQGGYGGAAFVANNSVDINGTVITCQDELSCIATPTAACCVVGPFLVCAKADACADAGFLEAGCPWTPP